MAATRALLICFGITDGGTITTRTTSQTPSLSRRRQISNKPVFKLYRFPQHSVTCRHQIAVVYNTTKNYAGALQTSRSIMLLTAPYHLGSADYRGTIQEKTQPKIQKTWKQEKLTLKMRPQHISLFSQNMHLNVTRMSVWRVKELF